jgi:anti-sigma factor RsiW
MTGQTIRDPCAERLSEYVDGELGAADRRRLDRHLEACADCRATVEALREVVRRAPGLVVDAAPSQDLWPGIAHRLTVRPRAWWRRVTPAPSMPIGRLLLPAAAALVIAALGGGLAWMIGHPPGVTPEQTAALPAPAPIVAPTVPQTPAALRADERYEDTVAELRRVVRIRLTADPYVVGVLDRNLDSIDMAIADYEDALARRPDDARLRDRLEAARRRKLELLRQAASLAGGDSN